MTTTDNGVASPLAVDYHITARKAMLEDAKTKTGCGLRSKNQAVVDLHA